jgi:pyruvate/2-oxoglutarate dehydrogenase complex dihydrolipoamide dehydrogenase (E3) component
MKPATEQPLVEPWDQHNQALVANVHPPDWVNPKPLDRYNLVVIGAGTAGLVTAAGAAGLGAKVALIEKHLMGGDCLNVGCVPSKAIIRSAHAAADAQRAADFGLRLPPGVEVDFPAVMERVRRIRAAISPHDSARRFSELGVDVFIGEAKFLDRESIEIGGQRLRFAKAVIATGARAIVPPIPGLAGAKPLTNETVFNLTERPARLAVIGAGPVGCELAQAFQRLGTQVTLFHHKTHILDREDADATGLVQDAFRRDGIQLALDARLQRVELRDSDRVLYYESGGHAANVIVDAILVAAGRAPNVEGLGLEAAGVAFAPNEGVRVDDFLRTTQPRIHACGDVCMKWKFTHAADFAARIVIQNALFSLGPFGRRRLSTLTMPWCTYTDPEIAHVGLYEREAHERGVELDTYFQPLEQVDRAITDGETEGFVKIHTRKGTGEILGATIVARHAGEMISEIGVAMAGKVGLGRLASVIHPYPTQAEAIRKCGDTYNRTRLTPAVKRFFEFWLRRTR